ncbi:MAG: VOC family protein [Deltaproteobacteria bacterium]|nr:VOC family protein [Deltaproteobacteria bacterium]
MILRIDHVAIGVKDYDKALYFFQDILGAIPGMSDTNDRMKYHWQSFSLGDQSGLELISPTGRGSFLDNFFKKRQYGGVHHITLQSPDIYDAKKRLEDNNIPYFGFNADDPLWKELFIHPQDAFGVLIQIAEFNPYDWLKKSEKLSKGHKWMIEKQETGCTISLSTSGKRKVKLDLTTSEIKKLISDLEGLC